jgi:hypothetical protein
MTRVDSAWLSPQTATPCPNSLSPAASRTDVTATVVVATAQCGRDGHGHGSPQFAHSSISTSGTEIVRRPTFVRMVRETSFIASFPQLGQRTRDTACFMTCSSSTTRECRAPLGRLPCEVERLPLPPILRAPPAAYKRAAAVPILTWSQCVHAQRTGYVDDY